MRYIIAALVLAVSLVAWGKLTEPAYVEDPHSFVDDQEQCDVCHVVTWDGDVGELESDEFSSSLTDVCVQCHEENLKRSHPVGVTPYKIIDRESYPAELVLQWSDDAMEDVITCATCHGVHVERFSDEKLFSRQKAYPGGEERYLTYALRIHGDTPRDGFAPLCKSCHPRM
jgi:cytochrome c553